MTTLTFKLEVFEGPLDLLLHLINKHKLNIHDIEISHLLEQYLAYIEEARQQDFELAGEFLEMAARLVYIKTVSLLPKPEEALREKQALEGILIEYALCKQAAQRLREGFLGDDCFVRKPMRLKMNLHYCRRHAPEELARVYQSLGSHAIASGKLLSDRINEKAIQPKAVSVISKVVYVLRTLYKGKCVTVESLYEGMTDRSSRVAIFLAVLELTRFGRIALNEDNTMLTICR